MKVSSLQRNLIYSQLCFWVMIVVNIALSPKSLGANGGMSYFGHTRVSVAPFELGMFATAYFLLQARRLISGIEQLRFFSWCLLFIVLGAIGAAIAPAIGNGLLDTSHRIFGTITFVTQLVLVTWLIIRFQNDMVSWLLYGLLLTGGVIAMIYLAPAQGFSIQGQLLFQAAFSAILLRTSPRLLTE